MTKEIKKAIERNRSKTSMAEAFRRALDKKEKEAQHA